MRKYLLILLLYPCIVHGQVTDTLYAINPETGDTIKYVSSYLTTTYTNGDPLLFRNVAQHKRGTVSPLSLPISTATQAALDLKATGSGTASGTNTGDNATNTQYSGLAASKENTITAGTTAQYWRGDKSWQTLDKTAVGLSNVANSLQLVAANNLSDLTNAGTARTNIGLGNVTNESKATMFTSPTFTGTTSGITATMVGLGNVTNESKATMFTSPTFTGHPVIEGVTSTGATGTGKIVYDGSPTLVTPALGTPASGNLANCTFPTLNQNTTGTAGGLSADIAESRVTNLVSDLAAKAPLASPAFTGTPTGIGIPVYGRVTGSNATTTGQSLVDIAGLTVALAINATYEFEAVLSVSTTAVTTGTQYGINYSVAGGAIEAGVNGPLTSTASKAERITALNTATSAYLTTSAQTGQVVIKGIVTTAGNAGNLTVKHLKVTSGTSTIFINSYLKVTRIL